MKNKYIKANISLKTEYQRHFINDSTELPVELINQLLKLERQNSIR